MRTRIQVIGVPYPEFYDAVVEQVSGGDTLIRTGPAKKNSATFGHTSYDSLLVLSRGPDGVVLGEVMPGTKDKKGSRMLGAFIGFLRYHLGDSIYTVSIQFD
jgi:hypothetical protein